MSSSARETALDALRLAEADPRRALKLADAANAAAIAAGDLGARAIAARAIGLAKFHLHSVDDAVAQLRRAIGLARRAGEPRIAAEARMTLAFALNWRGRPAAALREIDAAVGSLNGVSRARATAQRGAILHLLGRLDDAFGAYREALPVLRRAKDLVWVQRVLCNRGNLRARRQEFVTAEADLLEAEQICRDLELEMSVGFVHHNLGHMHTLRGDIPAALHYLDLAEERFRRLGSQLGPLLVDRSEVLLSARLISEGRAAAEAAVDAYQSEGRGIVLPEARLLLARVAQLDGDLDTALLEARAAAREFARLGQAEWAAIARVRMLSIMLATDPAASVGASRIAREAAAAKGRWPGAELELRLAAARRALERGQKAQARRLLGETSRHRRSGPATLRAGAWYAEALRRRASDDRPGAVRAARTGLQVLDAHAAALGATDLRANAAAHRERLVELGLRTAFDERSAARVFDWAELGRARHLQYPPARPPDDPRLATALSELRAIVSEIQERRAAGRTAPGLVARQRELERVVRDHHRRLRGSETAGLSTPSLKDVGEALADAALLEFIDLDGTMHGLCVVDGRATLHSLGPVDEITRLVGVLPFALHRLVRRKADRASREAAAVLVRDTAARLDAMLVRSVPGLDGRPLVIVPTGPLQPLPWSILPSCAGRPVTVAPSATLWSAAQARSPLSGQVIVAAGPGLPGAQAEARAVAATYDAKPMLDEAATVSAVTAELDSAPLAHLAAHGTVRADNPLFSALHLADGPLMVYDLQRLRRLPHTVVIAACDSGRAVAPVGDELMGLSATFLAQGTAQLIASVIPIHDIDTMPLMIALHEGVAAGLPAAAALAAAQEAVYRTDAEGLAAAAGFVCFGAGLAGAIGLTPEPSDLRKASSRAT
jgi:tetratricopeptide (TPR) repeat protein